MFDRLIRGQNEWVAPDIGGGSNSAKACRWCRLVESGEHVVCDEPAFVVLEGPARRRGGYVTLVTRAHVSVITQLPLAEMGAVLAGLTRTSDQMTRTSGSRVHIHAHPVGRRGGRGHLHFRLGPESPVAAKASSGPEVGLSAFASLAEPISH